MDKQPTKYAPVMKIEYKKTKDKCVISIKVKCPFCGKPHNHGGGTDLEKVSQMFSLKWSHCNPHELCNFYQICW